MKRVFIVGPNDQTEPLVAIHCADETRELQAVLLNNFDLLAGEQITPPRPRRWLLIRKEMPVPDPTSGTNRWAIDFLFVDQDAIPTFVECKRFNDTRSRREVVGQVMEYAANGQFYWDHECLKTFAEEAAKSSGESLEDSLAELQQEEQLASELFFRKTAENLKEGKIRIIFFMEEAPIELKSIVEFLNNQMDRTEILIVEARQYSKDNLRLIVPSLFGYTEQARRMKMVSSIETAEERHTWNRVSVLKHIANNSPEGLLERLESLLGFIDSHRERLRDVYGTGQNPSIIVKNDNGDSILYIYTSGIVQLPLAQVVKSYDFTFVQSLLKQYAAHLLWKGDIEPTKYPSLQKKLQALNGDEQRVLQEFLLALVSGQSGESRE